VNGVSIQWWVIVFVIHMMSRVMTVAHGESGPDFGAPDEYPLPSTVIEAEQNTRIPPIWISLVAGTA